MTPPVSDDRDSRHDPRLQSLASAFEGLLLTVHQLSCRDTHLQQRLKYAHNEYVKLADQLPVQSAHTRAVSEEIAAPQPDFGRIKPADAVRSLAESGQLDDQTLVDISEGLGFYQSIVRPDAPNGCPVANGAPGLEKDFTTNGTQGRLRCPFAGRTEKWNGVEDASKVNGDTCGHEDLDPIKAERDEKHSSTASASTARCPVSRCPIRFLNQHSPQEVADYVERHKHEIPRSHAVCVQRYQRNSQTMRQLDSKYGGVISMIQGLGEKHQSFLPNRGNMSNSASGGVDKWAADVDSKSQVPATVKEDEERKGHFDRPLREIRVGESPSRPWGIPVPAPQSPAAPVNGELDKGEGSSAQPFQNSPTRPGCPFGHGRPDTQGPAMTAEKPNEPPDPPDLEKERGKGGVVFNGPVFFGYTAEQTAGLMQQLG
ncbi:hypothetical protein PHISP_06862 [Aspergillus sp. HF37]|nr:hypothetical protein PHISP_06862 [Aspergillus sp. HF37]